MNVLLIVKNPLNDTARNVDHSRHDLAPFASNRLSALRGRLEESSGMRPFKAMHHSVPSHLHVVEASDVCADHEKAPPD
jgi:hypothetical protein